MVHQQEVNCVILSPFPASLVDPLYWVFLICLQYFCCNISHIKSQTNQKISLPGHHSFSLFSFQTKVSRVVCICCFQFLSSTRHSPYSSSCYTKPSLLHPMVKSQSSCLTSQQPLPQMIPSSSLDTFLTRLPFQEAISSRFCFSLTSHSLSNLPDFSTLKGYVINSSPLLFS